MDTDAGLISAIHHSGYQMALAITGGGASVIGELLRVPGGSASVLEAVVPYHWNSLVEYLGGAPDHACSARTARAMAMAAFLRARRLAKPASDVDKLLGVGCTASLASDRPKRGAHRFHLAIQSAGYTDCLSFELEKGLRTRAEEERFLTDYLIVYIAMHTGVASLGVHSFPASSAWERDSNQTYQAVKWATPEERALLLGSVRAVGLLDQTTLGPDQTAPGPRLLLPGAFNPIHAGHRRMAAHAQSKYGPPAEFELSIENVAKPPLDYVEIAERLDRFQPDDVVWLTRAPSFLRKSELFPGATFLVGIDTIVRVADPKYAGSVAARDHAIATIAQRGCHFLVFGRTSGDQRFDELSDVQLPPSLRAICAAVPESEFREDISSTELRRQQQQEQQ